MALSGLHVVCAYFGGPGNGAAEGGFGAPQAVISDAVWSQTMATAGTTANAAPSRSAEGGRPIFRIRASEDVFVAVGADPDASTGARYFVSADADYDVFASKGDKLAWVAA